MVAQQCIFRHIGDTAHLYRRDEPVAAPRHRGEVRGIGRRFAQRGANLREAEVQPRVEVDVMRIAPDDAAQLVAGDERSGAIEQCQQHREGLGRQLHGHAVPAQLGVVGVELERAESIRAAVLGHHDWIIVQGRSRRLRASSGIPHGNLGCPSSLGEPAGGKQ